MDFCDFPSPALSCFLVNVEELGFPHVSLVEAGLSVDVHLTSG